MILAWKKIAREGLRTRGGGNDQVHLGHVYVRWHVNLRLLSLCRWPSSSSFLGVVKKYMLVGRRYSTSNHERNNNNKQQRKKRKTSRPFHNTSQMATLSSLGKMLGTSPELSMLLMSSTNDSLMIWVSENKNAIGVFPVPAPLRTVFRSSRHSVCP